jgi:hypothetical protein
LSEENVVPLPASASPSLLTARRLIEQPGSNPSRAISRKLVVIRFMGETLAACANPGFLEKLFTFGPHWETRRRELLMPHPLPGESEFSPCPSSF